MAVLGARTTQNTFTSNNAIDIDPQLKYIQEYQTPITQWMIMDKAASKSVKESRSKFRWNEKTPLSRQSTLTAGLTGGSATESGVAVGDYTLFRHGDTCFIESTGDMLVVTNDVTSNSINFKAVGGGNITTASAGAVIRIINSAKTEVYTRQKSLTNNPTQSTGFCQIGLDAVEISGREDAADKYTDGEDFEGLIDEKLVELSKYEERKWLYNSAAYDDTAANITYSAGFRGTVLTNVKYFTGAVDETEIGDALQQVFAKQDTHSLMAYAGATYMRQIDTFLKETFTYNTDDVIKVYGGLAKKAGSPKLLKWMSPWGEVTFCWNPMLEGDVYSKACLFLNRKYVKMRYMKNDSKGSRKFRIEPNVQDNGGGSFHDQMMWDTGLEVGPEVYHGWHLPS